MRLRINLASYDRHQTRRIGVLLFFCSLLLVSLGALQVRFYLSYQGEKIYLKQGLEKGEKSLLALEEELRSRGLNTTEAGLGAFVEQITSFNRFIEQKAFSWTLFLNELEAAVPKNISVKRVQPRFPEGTITLVGQGLLLKDLTRLMVQLEESDAFEDVFLRRQNTNSEGLVEFVLEFKYRPRRQTV